MKFSVIIPAYNAEKYIERALLSVINQTYNNLEIIVVNDGSTDLTEKIIKNFIYSHKECQIILESIPNGGLANARNVGIGIARGDYFCNLDADDYLEPIIFEKIASLDFVFDICFYGFRDIEDDTGRCVSEYQDRFSYFPKPLPGSLAALSKIKKEMWICQGNAVYSLNMIRSNNIWNIKGLNQGEDFYFIMRALIHAKSVCSIPIIAFNCTIRKDSMMHSPFNETHLQTLQAYKLLQNDILNYSFLGEYKTLLLLYVKKYCILECVNIAKRICDAQNLLGVMLAVRLIKNYCYSIEFDFLEVKSIATFKEKIQYLIYSNSKWLFFYFCKLYRIFHV